MRTGSPLLLLLALAAGACSSPIEPELHATAHVPVESVQVSADPAPLSPWLTFTVPVVVSNAGRTAIALEPCGFAVEGRSGSEWVTVWSPICTAASGPPTLIPAGESRDLALPVTFVPDGPGNPRWDSQMLPGMYRLRLTLVPARWTGEVPATYSNPFSVMLD